LNGVKAKTKAKARLSAGSTAQFAPPPQFFFFFFFTFTHTKQRYVSRPPASPPKAEADARFKHLNVASHTDQQQPLRLRHKKAVSEECDKIGFPPSLARVSNR
jgi:hypothetical protein